MPRILFITCMPLQMPRSASMAFMGILLEKYPDLFTWYSLRPPLPEAVNPFYIPYAYSKSIQHLARFPRLKQFIQYFPWAFHLGRQAAAFGRAQKVQVVLADLAFEAIVAGRVAAQVLGVPLLVMVHDDPVNRIRVRHTSAWLVGPYEREFVRTLHVAHRCAVISDYMGKAYQERYGIETVTLFPGVEPEKCLPSRALDPQKSPIVIGSVGSVTSAKNWSILLEAVCLLNQWHGRGKFRVLHVGALPKDLSLSEDVETTGWLPEADLVYHLSRMDIGFLNWDFAPEMAATRCTSFPLKTSSYIQAQVPMLALGPEDSTVTRFVHDHRCGLACTEPSANKLAMQLEIWVSNEERQEEAKKNIEQLKKEFSRHTFFERFDAFVNLANKICE